MSTEQKKKPFFAFSTQEQIKSRWRSFQTYSKFTDYFYMHSIELCIISSLRTLNTGLRQWKSIQCWRVFSIGAWTFFPSHPIYSHSKVNLSQNGSASIALWPPLQQEHSWTARVIWMDIVSLTHTNWSEERKIFWLFFFVVASYQFDGMNF